MEQSCGGRRRLECDHPAEYLAAIVPCHPHGCDLRSPLIRVENRRTAYIRASVGEVHRPFRVMRKARKEFLSNGDHLIGLSAELSHFPRDDHILRVAIGSPKRIKRKRAWRGPPPREDHPCVESPSERDTNP